jgi:hypothetical protein
MDMSDLQRHVVGVLERLGVAYFITGSTATIFFGEPRFTNDLDVVADLKMKDVPGFLSAFPPEEFYLSEDAVRLAIAKRFQFNIIPRARRNRICTRRLSATPPGPGEEGE